MFFTKPTKNKFYYHALLIISVLSIINIASTSYIANQYEINDVGAIAFILGMFFLSVFGVSTGSFVMAGANLIFSLGLIFIILAIVEYFKLKKSNKQENHTYTKKFKGVGAGLASFIILIIVFIIGGISANKETQQNKEMDNFGYTSESRMALRKMEVENWQRAEYLIGIFNKLESQEEKKDLWDELVEKKIITKTVANQLNILMENDNENDQQIKENKWYSVKLVNGEIYYGQIFNTKSNPLIIKNIYYDYDQISNNNEELINPDNLRLVKRGNEKNGNDGTMEIIRTKVLFIEPLRDDSKILQAILEYEKND